MLPTSLVNLKDIFNGFFSYLGTDHLMKNTHDRILRAPSKTTGTTENPAESLITCKRALCRTGCSPSSSKRTWRSLFMAYGESGMYFHQMMQKH